MLRKYILILLLCPLALFGQIKTMVVGHIESAEDNNILILSHRLGRTIFSDTIKITNGNFSFIKDIERNQKATIRLIHNGEQTNIGLPDVLDVYLTEEQIRIDALDSVKYANVSGSRINQEYNKYIKHLSKADDEINLVSIIWNSLDEKGKESFWFERDQRLRKARALKRDLMLEYAKENPESYFALSSLIELSAQNVDFPAVNPLFNNLSDDLKNSDAGINLKKKIDLAGLTIIGAIAPDFTQNDVNDNPVRLSDFRGKYVLLDFWASWCGPCRVENPNLVAADNKYKDKNFTILGVSLDQGKKDAWINAIEKDGLTWTQVCDLRGWDNEVAQLYSITGVPSSFLIDPNGKIIAKNLSGERLNEFLESEL